MNYHDDAVLASYAHASFEEQYDYLLALARRDTPDADVITAITGIIEQVGGGLGFILRLEAASTFLRLQGVPQDDATLREAAVLLVGGDYSSSHPLNPQDSVERLRAVKRTVLLAPRDTPERMELMCYIRDWEMALTADEIALYLA